MYCYKCGKQLRDGAKFCDECGAKIMTEEVNGPTVVKEGNVHKCPYCGEFLPSGVIKCPSCGKEIRDKKMDSSIEKLVAKLSDAGDDECKKIDIIKMYPIVNSKEFIIELMFLASSVFDEKYYITHKNRETVSSMWLAKITQCYEKSQMLFKDLSDLREAKAIYDGVQNRIKIAKRNKILKIISGIVLDIIGFAIFVYGIELDKEWVSYLGMVPLTGGVLLNIFSFKKKKTSKEIKDAKIERDRKEEIKRKEKEQLRKLEILREQNVNRGINEPSDDEDDE